MVLKKSPGHDEPYQPVIKTFAILFSLNYSKINDGILPSMWSKANINYQICRSAEKYFFKSTFFTADTTATIMGKIFGTK